MNIKFRYTLIEERWNAYTHIVGAVGSGVVGLVFLIQTIQRGSALDILSIVLMLLGVVSSYVFSAMYHGLPARWPWKEKSRKFDHASIFWHIAACYSPMTLIAFLRGGELAWGWGIFIFCWLFATVGTIRLLHKVQEHSNIETACYVLMGLTILVAIKPFYDIVGMGTLLWVILEGIAYLTGAVLYSITKVKYMHTVFHIFIMLGDAFHFVAVGRIIEQMIP
jgi:hemolysin III